MHQLKRSVRRAALREPAVSAGSSTISNTNDNALRLFDREYKSAIAKALSLNAEGG